MNYLDKFLTMINLGIGNILRVMIYRFGIKTGLNPVKKLRASIADGDFYQPVCPLSVDLDTVSKINQTWLTHQRYFGWLDIESAAPPVWFKNCQTGAIAANSDRPWHLIPDFDTKTGDVKTIWEASRFDWVVNFALAAKSGYATDGIDKLNFWLRNWLTHNSPYLGHNWKCGQEASLRVIHLAAASLICGQVKTPSAALVDLLVTHLQRIEPTLLYAVAQDNNHATSEAAALYIGGSWLNLFAVPDSKRWQELGLKWLENRADKLIGEQGSFSQHSVTYHRLMLDTFSFCEVWRRQLNLTGFSLKLTDRLKAATNWLYQFTDKLSGDAPNIGANDGAHIINLAGVDYRDFRPSVHLAAALFCNSRAYQGLGDWVSQLRWLGVEQPEALMPEQKSEHFADGGYFLLRNADQLAVLRYPRFRFRPSQCDVGHVDYFRSGLNILRDAGTFSYAASAELLDYFSGTQAHNTVQFDNHQQMPRISRFLFGSWLKAEQVNFFATDERAEASVKYRDFKGAIHHRSVQLTAEGLTVVDIVKGRMKKAILRWRLQPDVWCAEPFGVSSDKVTVKFFSEKQLQAPLLSKGLESRYYLQKDVLPVVELQLEKDTRVITEIRFK